MKTVIWGKRVIGVGALSMFLFFCSTVFAAPPTVVNDITVGAFQATVTIDVVANDTDNNGTWVLTIISVTDPTTGSTTIIWNQIEYTPDTGFCGTGTFVYTIEDILTEQSTGLVTVVSACGLIAVGDEYTTPMNTSISIPVTGLDANDLFAFYGVEGARWNFQYNPAFWETITANSGVVLWFYEHDTESFLYTPATWFCGEDTFDYEIEIFDSNTESIPFLDTGTVSVVVTCGQMVAVDDEYITPFETSTGVTRTEVVDNDIAEYSGTYWLDRYFQIGPAYGSNDVENWFIESDESQFTYYPNDEFCGTDDFDYTVGIYDANSGFVAFLDTGTITITVECAESDCGNYVLDDGEECDLGFENGWDECSDTCQLVDGGGWGSGRPTSIGIPTSNDPNNGDENTDETISEGGDGDWGDDNGWTSSLAGKQWSIAHAIQERNTTFAASSNVDLPTILPRTWVINTSTNRAVWLAILWVFFTWALAVKLKR